MLHETFYQRVDEAIPPKGNSAMAAGHRQPYQHCDDVNSQVYNISSVSHHFSRPLSHPTYALAPFSSTATIGLNYSVTPQSLVFNQSPRLSLMPSQQQQHMTVSKSAPGTHPRIEDVRELAKEACCREDVAAQLLRLTPSGSVFEALQLLDILPRTNAPLRGFAVPLGVEEPPPALPPRRPLFSQLPRAATAIVSSGRPGIVLRTAVSKEVCRPVAHRAEPLALASSFTSSTKATAAALSLTSSETDDAAALTAAVDSENIFDSPVAPPALPPRRRTSEAEPIATVSRGSTIIIRNESPRPQAAISQSVQKTATGGGVSGGSVVRPVSAQWAKFYMEQHFENLNKQCSERQERRTRLEEEMRKVGLSAQAQQQMRYLLGLKESHYLRMCRCKMDKRQFEKIKTLGVGAFGEVALVRKKDNGHLYAMKTLKKKEVLQRNQAAHVKAERDILIEADSEWVVKLFYSFQDQRFLYLIMEYIPGGDLMSLLIKKGIFEEPLALFYIVEMVLAIEGVHQLGFVHRDIKPDNILICANGHIKLTDFGLCTGFHWTHQSKYYMPGEHVPADSMDLTALSTAEGTVGNISENVAENCHGSPPILKPLECRRKLRKNLCRSLVGTPNYIAPEILDRKPYSKACDWWSVGVIAFEMLVGHPPFLAKTPAETQWKVINWPDYLRVPYESQLSKPAEEFIYKLCCGPDERISDPHLIRQMALFKDVDWTCVRNATAPYVPTIRHELDTSNFDPVEESRWPSDEHDDSFGEVHNGASCIPGDINNKEIGKGCSDSEAARASRCHQQQQVFPEFTFRRFFDRDNFY